MDRLVCVCLLTLPAGSLGDGNGPGVTKVIVVEGSDLILPCSLSSKEDIEFKLFDWKKDGQKEVFMYDAGIHYNNGRSGQDEQFKGRVSHFQDELKSGNASIIIRNVKVADSGDCTCDFPHLQPWRRSIIWLVVSPTLKDRAAENILAMKQDTDGKVLPADELHVSERGGRYYITLQTTVIRTKTNRFVCVAKQEDIRHIVDAEITVPEKMFEECKVPGQSNSHNIWLDIGLLLLGCVLGVGGTVIYFRYFKRRCYGVARGSGRQSATNGHAVQMSDVPSNDSNQRLTEAV